MRSPEAIRQCRDVCTLARIAAWWLRRLARALRDAGDDERADAVEQWASDAESLQALYGRGERA